MLCILTLTTHDFIVQQLPVVPGAGILKPIFKSNDVMHQREIYGHDPAFFFRPLQRWRRFRREKPELSQMTSR
jgi:hypothetical protein